MEIDPIWRGLRPGDPLPPRVRPWVRLESSMTARIAARTGPHVRVDLLRQGAGRLYPDEAGFFRGAAPGMTTVREICLSAGPAAGEEQPFMVARTVFTARILREHPVILGLGTRPLGALLFAGEKPSPWHAREWARIGSASPLFALLRRGDPGGARPCWARRTLFELFGAPLLVTEIFLPALIHHP